MASALRGIRVIETATAAAGPMTGRLLGDWGADVIHVEHPLHGDMGRSQGSLATVRHRGGRFMESDIDHRFENHNCNKRGMTLDLSQELGQDILYRMLKRADVFLVNFRPRELKKFKLEYETLSRLNPSLIFADVTGYGREGPDQDLPGYDFNAFWAKSGLLHVLQTPEMSPPPTPNANGDRTAAIALACGILVALFEREKNGIGQEVDVSLFGTGIFFNATDVGGSLVTGKDRQNINREDVINALQNSYKTKDGRWFRLALPQPDRYWSRFCHAIEREDIEKDPRFASFEPRIDNHLALFHILEEVFMSRPLAEWKVRLTEAQLPWAAVQTLPEVISDPQARANGYFVACDHPVHGSIELVANPVKLSKTPASVRLPAPQFGQHTEEILLEYDYTWQDINSFKKQGVIA
ncbi:CaiB/BaiF CoA transferase family protein [Chloroflexota bacterium]